MLTPQVYGRQPTVCAALRRPIQLVAFLTSGTFNLWPFNLQPIQLVADSPYGCFNLRLFGLQPTGGATHGLATPVGISATQIDNWQTCPGH